MIFVITGTESYPFDRFIKEIDRLKKENILKDDVFIQLGSCEYIPENCTWERYLCFGEMKKNIEEASIVISHGGAGTTLLCLQLNKIPVLVTRQKKYGEHLDNHQIPFARNMEKLGCAHVAYEVEDLQACLEECTIKGSCGAGIKKCNNDIIEYLNSIVV